MLTSVRLQHLRLYDDQLFDLSEGVNVVVGPNASGKTTLLEAILFLAQGSSYKAKDAELIQIGSEWARIDGIYDGADRTVKLEYESGLLKKRYIIDEKPLTRLLYNRTIPTVLFEPNHLLLLTTQPELRRGFLDDLIEHSVADYGMRRRQYKRVLAQRNALLKRGAPREQYFVWNIRLSELGGVLFRARRALISRLNERLSEVYTALARQTQDVSLTYASACNVDNYETDLLHQLESRLATDMERGFTTRGPHRDDFAITLNGRPVSAASRGETRTFMLALKVLETKLIEAAREVKPLLLLDDVFSELDAERRAALTAYVQVYQTCITTTNADAILEYFPDCKLIQTS